MRVVAPDGTNWEVERTWLARPLTSGDAPDPGDDAIEEAGERLERIGLSTDEWWGTALLILGSLIVALIFFVVLPALFALLGLLVAVCALGGRLISLTRWTVTARSSRVRMEWHVRGLFRSRRAIRAVASAIGHGEEWPLFEGRRPDVVVATQV